MDVFLHQYFDFNVVGDHLSEILRGFGTTLELSVVGGVLALVWGLILAALRQTPGRAGAPVRLLTIAYVDVLRGVPLLVIILMISGSLPVIFTGSLSFIGMPQWFGKPDPFWYGVMAITLAYGAYMAEVYRAGIEAVPGGQTEAARSLGMSRAQAVRYVILPQATRAVIPPLLNDLIALIKDTPLVLVISANEVVRVSSDIQAESLNVSALTMAAVLFLTVTLPLARMVDRLTPIQQAKYQRGIVGA